MDIYYLNLKERTDRLEKIKKNIENVNKNNFINLIIIEAVKHKRGEIGCGLSHQKIIKIAIEKKLDNIVIVEDDNICINNTIDIIKTAISSLPDDYDILLGGAHFLSNPIKITDNLFKIKKFSGTNFIMYNKSAYEKILKWERGHIDCFISNLSKNNKLNIYITYPFIGKSMPDYSDIKKKKINYMPKFNHYENTLKKYIEKYINIKVF